MLITSRLNNGKGAREEQETGLKLMRLTSSDAIEQRKTLVIAIETGRKCRVVVVEESKA